MLGDVPDALVGDAGRLRQIVVNLIDNAVKFTARGEVIMRVEQQWRREGEVCLKFSVADTGIGIAQEKLGILFHAFSQVDSSTTRKFGGTGLGLAICAQLVKLMGGQIWAESRLGEGSVFAFTARFRLATPVTRRNAPDDLASLRGRPVLVVDDNPTNRRILQEMLGHWGLRPTTVDGAPQALAEMRAAHQAGEPYAMVLLDNMMPEMDGFMLAAEIRRQPELVGSILMMLSSADHHENAARCRELGVTAYMTKPIKRAELLASLRNAATLAGRSGLESGRATPTSDRRSGARSGRAPVAIEDPCRELLSILVAEDNPVNQMLTLRLLEKRGHRVVVVANGRDAVDEFARRRFDVVLMDVQMPEMDGFEATVAIRVAEAPLGRRTPIVALTAHAMKGDRERCLAAGMDGYASKPVRPAELIATLERLAAEARRAAEPDSIDRQDEAKFARSHAGAKPEFDRASALERVAGDARLMKDLIGVFFEECPRGIEQIRRAIDSGDAALLRRSAHALKGAILLFGAESAADAAERLEAMGRAGDLSNASEACADLIGALDRLRPALAAFEAE